MDKGKAGLFRTDGHRGADVIGIAAREGGAQNGSPTPVNGFDRWVTERVIAMVGHPPFTTELWNGEVIHDPPRSVARLIFHDRRALQGLLYKTDLTFGDAYSAGRLEVQGDLVKFLESLFLSVRRSIPNDSIRRRISNWLNRPHTNSETTARGNIQHHYDLGNDFYRLWLDEQMVYTCAYYPSPESTLEQAQIAKMEHVCRKLRLKPGLRVVEAGCGWGALALYMARRYQVQVTAYNISREQLAHARARAAGEGLEQLVTFVEEDYRTISGKYDRFVSIGMLEHVGVDNFKALGALVRRTLAPNGLGLIHSIGRNAPARNNPWIEQRIFPGSRPPSLGEITEIFEPEHLSVLDVENLRLHYGRTCRDWLERYENVADSVSHMYDSSFMRAWRLYLAGSVAGFTTGSLQLFQVLFSHEENNDVPTTRDHLYRPAGLAVDEAGDRPGEF